MVHQRLQPASPPCSCAPAGRLDGLYAAGSRWWSTHFAGILENSLSATLIRWCSPCLRESGVLCLYPQLPPPPIFQ
ncbi:hypothetical protein KCP70_07630 [Salmonella enterica subsp. enterica]|nr:hypothetical protein KCP70_07630 [Salmonella enterica subsp. enterica]